MKDIDRQENQTQLGFLEEAKELVAQFSEKLGHPASASVITFGCQMNARDSEKLIGILHQAGFEIRDEDESSDFVVYNTCTVRDNANQKLYGRLGVAGGFKKRNPLMKIALCGCMMQEEVAVAKIKESYRFVDLIFGTHNLFRFPELLVSVLSQDGMIIDVWDKTDRIVEDLPVERKYPFKSGVNIMFGCDNFCTYCIVPYVRGRERSREAKDILREVERLAQDGVVEVMLLGQNVNSYGKGLDDAPSFAQLLNEVAQVKGIERVRFMTSHPKDLSEELIQVMKNNDRICRHLHLPLQAGSDRILKAMNRRYTKQQFIDLALHIREEIPDIAITTDIMMGFPGETEEDIEDTLDVIRRVQFDNAFTFIYSKRTGTPAASMPDQVTEEFTRVQFDRILKLVQETARTQVARYQGQVLDALIEEVNDHDPNLVTGRLSNNTIVHVPGSADLIGSIRPVRLDECHGFYYTGSFV